MAMTNYIAANRANSLGYETFESVSAFIRASVEVYCPTQRGLLSNPEARDPAKTDTYFGQALYLGGISIDDLPRFSSVAHSNCDLWPTVTTVAEADKFDKFVQLTAAIGTETPIASLAQLSDPGKSNQFLRAGIVFYCPQHKQYIPSYR
ncbi:hypothetical protein C5E45_20135 [Nocardia nova]|uniref:DUF732 domain-containing protein n=2 Tax=Nocardia nova TaxID=37330 RepID=A0A2S6AMA5_9NOCA|nr:hypothetical protein C5E45_20135 [Nocardia nova]